MKRLSTCMVAVLAVFAAGMVPAGATGFDTDLQMAARGKTLVLGRVSDDSVKTLKRLGPMADYIAKQLGHLGYTAGEPVVARSNEEMADLIRSGEVDIVSETALSALWFAESVDAQPLMREWKKGVAAYQSVLIGKKGSGLNRLEDLRDKVVAFEDPGSTSGFLYPLAALRQAGLDPVPVKRGQKPPAGKVGYVFTRGEVNVATWVARGLADAGAISNLDWEDIARTPGILKSEIEVFYEGTPILRSVLLVRGDLDDSVKSAIRQVLAAMENDAEGKRVLKAYYKVKRYDEIVGSVADDLDQLRALYPLVKDAM